MKKALRWATPRRVHYLCLVLAAAWLVYLVRDQWFFYDEWDFLRNPGDLSQLLVPHVGHWSTAPMLIYAGLEQVFGLSTYWPYILLSLLTHLALAHVLWRVLNRVGVAPWISVSLALLFCVYAGGAENILWAFQIGFMGAILLGLIAALLIDGTARETFWRRYAAVLALLLVSLTFSGTALPLVLLVALVAWRRVGILRAVALIAPAAVVYLAWYVYAGATYGMGATSPATIGQLFSPTGVAHYAGAMIVGSFDALVPILPFIGIAVVVVIAAYFFATVVTSWRSRPLLLGMACAAVAFALLTAYSRINYGFDGAVSGRYLYVILAMILPLLGMAATFVALKARILYLIIVIGMLVVTAYNARHLQFAADNEAAREQHTHEILSAAATLLEDPALHIPDDAVPEPVYAPTVSAGQLRNLVESGRLPIGAFPPEALLTASANLLAQIAPAAAAPGCAPGTAATVPIGAAGIDITASSPAPVRITVVSADGTRSDPRTLTVPAGTSHISYTGAGTGELETATGGGAPLELCR